MDNWYIGTVLVDPHCLEVRPDLLSAVSKRDRLSSRVVSDESSLGHLWEVTVYEGDLDEGSIALNQLVSGKQLVLPCNEFRCHIIYWKWCIGCLEVL